MRFKETLNIEKCSNGMKPNILIWGDSHAMYLYQGFSLTNNNNLLQLTKSGCAPLIDVAEYPNRTQSCIKFNKAVFDYLNDNRKINTVIISSRFSLLDKNTKLLYKDKIVSNYNSRTEIVKNELSRLLDSLKGWGKNRFCFFNTI